MAEEDKTEPVIQYATKLLAYGIGDTVTETTIGSAKCYLQSISVSAEGDTKTYKDNTGQTAALVIPETWQVLQCEGLMIKGSAGGQMPKKGDEVTNIPVVDGMITGSGVRWRIESFSEQWSNEDVTKISMSVRSYRF